MKYLALNESVSIPGVGSLSLRHVPAKEIKTDIHPPVTHIDFEKGTALTDKNFYYFLSAQTGLSEVEAVRKFQDFSYQLRKDIYANDYIVLTGLGKFRKDPVADLVFEPSFQSGDYFSPIVPLPKQNHSEVEQDTIADVVEHEQTELETEEKEEISWLWPMVLGLAALAAIGYYYFVYSK